VLRLWAGAACAFFLAASACAQRLSPLASPPDWSELEVFQETITRAEFVRLLQTIYAPRQAAMGLIETNEDTAVIRKNLAPGDTLTLRFAKDAASAKPAPRFWRPKSALPANSDPQRTLAGVRIALDPGHLGGDWAKMEERWFQFGETTPVVEGDLTLRVAQHLATRLLALGAQVSLVRGAPGPTTSERPETLRAAARDDLALEGIANPPQTYLTRDDPQRATSVQFRSELLFFRTAEIRHRAIVVNEQLQPDLVVCLHLDADAWDNPEAPAFTLNNRLHAIVNGTYSAAELRNDDVRHDMLLKLLGRAADTEVAANTTMVETLAKNLALPPYIYKRDNATPAGCSPYVWARNLLANRLYRCPVVYLEPYAMNCREVWERVQAGDYEGERVVAGSLRPSLHREYADAVAEGLCAFFKERP
jgi:N-acetylmuramoyl-L-alanine amidase